MAGTASGVNFAVIGHQDSWQNIERFVNGLRTLEQEQLSVEKLKNIFPFIPPRVLFKVNVKSLTGSEINGIYIDCFIDPEKLTPQYSKTNIRKVMQAAACADKQEAAITTLGGFASILQEGNLDGLSNHATRFTTGNTLTAAFIVKGVEAAARQLGISVANSKMLIVGATGDLGMACTAYFKNKVSQLLLCAQNTHRLEKLAQQLRSEKINTRHSVSAADLLPEADIVICVASSMGLHFTGWKKAVLVCDAGYPKNLAINIHEHPGMKLFHGGMGQVTKGFSFNPDYSTSMYQYPAPCIAHGCILEAMVLAFENKIENYSAGKGNITCEKMEEIYGWALKHGITLSPFHNANGLWSI